MRAKLRVRAKVARVERTEAYFRLRYYWLHELRTLRAKRRYGTAKISELKAAQRVLAKLRKEERI